MTSRNFLSTTREAEGREPGNEVENIPGIALFIDFKNLLIELNGTSVA